jgi:hypothetical protein
MIRLLFVFLLLFVDWYHDTNPLAYRSTSVVTVAEQRRQDVQQVLDSLDLAGVDVVPPELTEQPDAAVSEEVVALDHRLPAPDPFFCTISLQC